MTMTRFYFDNLITHYKTFFPGIVEGLAANSGIVHYPVFENGVFKIQNGDELKLMQDD